MNLDQFNGIKFPPVSQGVQKDHKWLCVSALQKSIRRSETASSLHWAKTLWKIDPNYLLYRMVIISQEEIACANPSLAHRFLQTGARKKWFEENGGFEALAPFVVDFSTSTKNRESCDLISISLSALLSPPKIWTQQGINIQSLNPADQSKESQSERVVIANNTLFDVRARFCALWLLAGTERVPHAPWGTFEGDYITFLRSVIHIAQNQEVLSNVQKSLMLCKDAIPLGLALVHEPQNQETQTILPDLIAHSDSSALLATLAGLDKHTKEGRICISDWASKTPELKDIYSKPTTEQKLKNTIEQLLFRLEGGVCNDTLQTSIGKRIDRFLTSKIEKETQKSLPDIQTIIVKHLPALNELRVKALRTQGILPDFPTSAPNTDKRHIPHV